MTWPTVGEWAGPVARNLPYGPPTHREVVVGLLGQALYLYGWYAAAVIGLGLGLVLATWLIHSAIRWWKKQ